MTKIYVNFLGYTKAEGGIVEIFTPDTFSIGSINLENGETEFDDFSFKCQNSDIFLTRPVDNEGFLLQTDIKGTGVVTSAVISGVTTPADGDFLWIENERVQVFEGPGGTFDIYRGKNSSIPVCHRYFDVDGRNKIQLTITKKRISPIGLIVKITTDENKILAYGQISEASKINTGFVSVSCKNLYNQLENSTIDIRTAITKDRYVSWLGNNTEFSQLLDNPYTFFAPIDFKEQDYEVQKDNKEWFQQNLNCQNLFISFDKNTGRYKINKFGRIADASAIEKRLISKEITRNGGVFEVETQAPIGIVNAKTKEEEFTVTNSDSNFINYYTSAKKIDIDLSKCYIPDTEDRLTIIKNLAYVKMFMMNSISEKISFSVDRYNTTFEVGKYYKLLDLYKFDTFYKDDSNLFALCISIDEVKCSFLRTEFFEAKQVAPAFIVKKTAANTYTAENLDGLQDYVTCFDTTKEIENLTNPLTNSVCFEAYDNVIIFSADGTLTETTITSITGNVLVLATNTGAVGDIFIFSIQNYNSGSIQSKNSVYLFDNGLGVL